MEGPAVKWFCDGAVDLVADVDADAFVGLGIEDFPRTPTHADDGAASTTNQADMRGLLRRAEPHDTASSGAASV